MLKCIYKYETLKKNCTTYLLYNFINIPDIISNSIRKLFKWKKFIFFFEIQKKITKFKSIYILSHYIYEELINIQFLTYIEGNLYELQHVFKFSIYLLFKLLAF